MNIKIEHGIPIPSVRTWTGCADIVRQMKVGDSIVVGLKNYPGFYGAALRLGFRMTYRKLPNGKLRCWLIERKKS